MAKVNWPVKIISMVPATATSSGWIVAVNDYGPDKHGLPKISRSCYRGTKVLTLNELYELGRTNKCVIISNGGLDWNKPVAANWILGRSGRKVYDYLHMGRLYHCIKEEDFE